MCSCMCTAMDVSDEASSEVDPSDVASFAVGDTFSSYDDLKKKLAEFKKSHSVQLTRREMSNERAMTFVTQQLQLRNKVAIVHASGTY